MMKTRSSSRTQIRKFLLASGTKSAAQKKADPKKKSSSRKKKAETDQNEHSSAEDLKNSREAD